MTTFEFRLDYRRFNPWWETNDITHEIEDGTVRRSDHTYKRSHAQENEYLGIAGPAGSGRTTLLLQLAADLVEEGVTTPRDILYLPLSEPQFRIGSSLIEDAVTEFATYTRPARSETTGYVLLDDAHACSNWDEQVEWVLTRYDDLHVIATLPAESNALPDRISTLEIDSTWDVTLPAKFQDYARQRFELEFEDESYPIVKEDTYTVRDQYARATQSGDTDELIEALQEVRNRVSSCGHEERFRRLAMSYVTMSARNQSPTEVANDTELTIYRDVPRIERFENLDDLHALVGLAAENPGERFEFSELADTLECDPRTVRKYVETLAELFILTPSYQYDHSRRRSVKLWLRDPLLLSALADVDRELPLSREAERLFIPTVVFDHLRRLVFHYQNKRSDDANDSTGDGDHDDSEAVAYDNRGTEPVDFVIEGDSGTPIPVALTLDRQRGPETAIRSFCDRSDAEAGLVVGRKRTIDVDGSVVSVPLWLFLVCC